MRKGKFINLTWDNIDFERGCITLYETKNGEIRVVPLVCLSYKLLKDYMKVQRFDTKLLFPGNNSSKPCDIRQS
jgi:integrase